ncbi:hypothetical protein CC80DRAFT_98042 [Byssothecium circinans]|uniref:RCC1/BLIP-II n=1 Tax=Byssothecium circinans TaxID=147558 RepID=A0A6A5UDI9_9PLEO|nr:hypothetical protein CC80DRAFT_98042 [Byssothecium circinans]
MMELYAFGHSVHDEWTQKPSQPPAPVPVLSAQSLEILWASWCDLIIAHSPENQSRNCTDLQITYYGTSLLPRHAAYINSLTYSPSHPLTFFGTKLHEGLKGFISRSDRQVRVFRSERESKEDELGIEVGDFESLGCEISDIQFTSREHGLACINEGEKGTGGNKGIIELPSLNHLLRHLQSHMDEPISHPPYQVSQICIFIPAQWTTNATTVTALDDEGTIYTYAEDMRYPKCLGRERLDRGTAAQPIPYFSETTVSRIASGGYYTCAITSDGELFIWGQSPPGIDNELSVLQRQSEDGDEDEFVRSVELLIEGRAATVTDVAVGWGHVLVAAEVQAGSGVLRAVFAAGCNERGQLGLGSKTSECVFVEDFTEVKAFRGKKTRGIACAGWSSYVMIE